MTNSLPVMDVLDGPWIDGMDTQVTQIDPCQYWSLFLGALSNSRLPVDWGREEPSSTQTVIPIVHSFGNQLRSGGSSKFLCFLETVLS